MHLLSRSCCQAPSVAPTTPPTLAPTRLPTQVAAGVSRPRQRSERSYDQRASQRLTGMVTKACPLLLFLRQVPTSAPTARPTQAPTQLPTLGPTQPPTQLPTLSPTTMPPTGIPPRPANTPPHTPGSCLTVLGPFLCAMCSASHGHTNQSALRYARRVQQEHRLSPTRALRPLTLVHTAVPSSAPTRPPSTSPTASPTVQPTAFTCSLSLLTTYSQRSTSTLPVLNPSQGLSITATCTRSLLGVWTSPNATISSYISKQPPHHPGTIPPTLLSLGSGAHRSRAPAAGV